MRINHLMRALAMLLFLLPVAMATGFVSAKEPARQADGTPGLE